MLPLNLSFSRKQTADIYIGQNCWANLPVVWRKYAFGTRVFILSNPTVAKLYLPPLQTALSSLGLKVTVLLMPDRERAKNLLQAKKILDAILESGCERQDVVLALGGGVVGDLAGFCAALCLRGLNFVQVPTTLLAQVDSAVGGKTAVNHAQGKNLIGAFYQPCFTWIDINLLKTLPKPQIYSGLAEIIKYGVIMDEPFFVLLETNVQRIKKMDFSSDAALWQKLVESSCRFKAAVVMADEEEHGLRATLNFGHTIGHGLEAAGNYKTHLHGEAVAIGMLGAAWLARDQKLFKATACQRLQNLLTDLGFNLSLKDLDLPKILTKMHNDKKVLQQQIRFVLPTSLGQTTMVTGISDALILQILQQLKELVPLKNT